MSETVIREVAKDVWTFSRPFSRYGLIPFGGRSTAIKMKNGGVWLLASTPLEKETKAKLDELGSVRFIVGADAVHHLYLGDYKSAYPDAKLIAPQEAMQRHGDENLKFDGLWGKDPEDAKYGFEDDVKACFFSGFRNKDVAFFHPASKVLIEADLLFNFPATEQIPGSGQVHAFFLVPSKVHMEHGYRQGVRALDFNSPVYYGIYDDDNFRAMRRDVKTVMEWDFEKIIPCHGDVIEKGGKEAWQNAFKFYLD